MKHSERSLGYTTGLSISQGSILAPLHFQVLSHQLLQCPHSTYHYTELPFILLHIHCCFFTSTLMLQSAKKIRVSPMELFMLKPMSPNQDLIYSFSCPRNGILPV